MIIKDLQEFQELTGYYWKFALWGPLTTMLHKNALIWTLKASTTFEQLKKAMISTSIVALPNFSKFFIAKCDTWNYGIETVLQQGGVL